jgi:hypothetical protein
MVDGRGPAGPGVQEIVRYHGRHVDAGETGTVNITVELDGEVLASKLGTPLVNQIRMRTGFRGA